MFEFGRSIISGSQTWWFPEIGIPPQSSISMGFSLFFTIQLWGYLHDELEPPTRWSVRPSGCQQLHPSWSRAPKGSEKQVPKYRTFTVPWWPHEAGWRLVEVWFSSTYQCIPMIPPLYTEYTGANLRSLGHNYQVCTICTQDVHSSGNVTTRVARFIARLYTESIWHMGILGALIWSHNMIWWFFFFRSKYGTSQIFLTDLPYKQPPICFGEFPRCLITNR